MNNFKWEEVYEMLKKIINQNTDNFSANSFYFIIRRYRPDLPFHSESYMKDYKKKNNKTFASWSEIFQEFFQEFSDKEKLDLINYIFFHLHQNKSNKRELKKLELYLDQLK